MRDLNRFGLVAGLAAALAFNGAAQAQTQGEPPAQPEAAQPGTAGGQETTGAQQQPGYETQTRQQTQQRTPLKESLTKQLEKLHAANRAEAHMASMAEQKAQSAEVKEYARKLGEDHKQLDEKLVSQASTLGVNLEGKEYAKAYKDAEKNMRKLEGKTGANFDKEFMSMAVKDHKKDQKNVQKAADEARDENQQELAQFLSSADTGLQGHLDEAQRIQDQLKQSGAQRQGRRGTQQ